MLIIKSYFPIKSIKNGDVMFSVTSYEMRKKGWRYEKEKRYTKIRKISNN